MSVYDLGNLRITFLGHHQWPSDERTFASTSRHNNQNTVLNLHNAPEMQLRLRYKHTTWVHGHHRPYPCHSEAALNKVYDQSNSTLSTFAGGFLTPAMSHAQVSSSDSACWPAEYSTAAQSVAALGRRRGEDNISSYNDKRARR